MKKRTRVSRILALVLTLSLVFQQAGITTYADDGTNEAAVSVTSDAGEDNGAEVTASQEETKETGTTAAETAETSAPATEAAAEADGSATKETTAETSAPVTEAAQSSTSEQETPDTSAAEAEANAANGDAAEETVAEETTEAVTEATTDTAAEGETEATTDTAAETGAEAAAEAETEMESETAAEIETETESEVETESETEVETETESETETEEYPDTFVWEDDEKTVTVVLSNPEALPLGVEFVVEDLTEEEYEAYKTLIIEQQFANDETYGETVEERTALAQVLLANMVLFDMHFEYEGTEIEPDANTMSVTIKNKKAVDVSPETVAEADGYVFVQEEDTESSIVAIHIEETGKEETVVDVTEEVKTNSNGEVKTVELTVEGFSTIGYFPVETYHSLPITDETLLKDWGGSYTLNFILNNYNIFSSGDVVAQHTVGAVAVGGTSSFTYGIGASNYGVHPVPSYFHGGFASGGFNSYIGGNTLYFTGYDYNVKDWAYTSYDIRFNDGGTGTIDSSATHDEGYFIDFTAAMAKIQSEISYYSSAVGTVTVDMSNTGATLAADHYEVTSSGDVTLHSGYSFLFSDLDAVASINIVTDGSESQDVNIISQEGGTIVLPKVHVNGADPTGSESDVGCGLVFMLPNATTVDIGTKSNGTFLGHVVAPNAEIFSDVSGNTNGGFICASFNVPKMENHMWHYNGNIIVSGFTAAKTVNGATPAADDDTFTFHLYEYNSGQWVQIQSKTSSASTGLVAFDKITYSVADDLGTHWYLISEVTGDTSKYTFDTTLYLVRVVVAESTASSSAAYSTTYTYYKAKSGYSANDLIVTHIVTKLNDNNEEVQTTVTSVDEDKLEVLNASGSEANTSSIFTFDNTTGQTAGGSLKIKKNVLVNKETVSSWCQTAADGDYYFQVYDSGNNVAGSATITIKNGVSTTTGAEISGLAAGTYTVKEVSSTSTSAGSAEFFYALDAEGNTVTTNSVTVEVTAGNQTNVPTVEFVNNLTIEGSLEISKTLAGNDPDADEEFAFTITLIGAAVGTTETYKAAYTRSGSTDPEEDIVFTNGSATVYLKGGESVVISKLPAGVSYTVTEKTNAGADVTTEGYEAEVSDDGGTTKYDQDNISGTISKDGTTVAFTNTKDSYGNLTIQKMVDGNGGDDDEPFTFKVTFTGDADSLIAAFGTSNVTIDTNDPSVGTYTYTFELMHNENEIIRGIPANVTFTVEELSANTKGYETSMKVTSGTAMVSNDKLTVTGTITEDCSIAVECTNTREEGNLLISKVFDTEGNDNVSTDEFTFEISLDSSFDTSLVNGDYVATYTDQDGTAHSKTVTFASGRATVTMKAGESWLITGLLSGLTFTVTETAVKAKDNTTHTYTTTVQVGSNTAASGTSADVTIPDATQNVAAGTWTASTESVTFTNRRDTYGELVVSKTVDSNGGNEDYTKEFIFTITLDNMTLAVGETVEYDAKLTTTEDTAHGIAAASKDKKVSFAVDQTDGKVKATVELSHNQSLKISGLPNGVTYTVSEADYSSEGWETYPPHDTSGTIVGGETKTVAYENLKETGALEITKQIAGNAASADEEFEFTITVWTTKTTLLTGGSYTVKLIDNGTETSSETKSFDVNGQLSFTLKAEQTLIIEGLPTDTYYEIEETSANGYSTTNTVNGTTSTVGTKAEGTISASIGTGSSANEDVIFTNTKDTYGDLLIKKTVDSNAETEAAGDSDYEKEFTFTVTLNNVTLADGETVEYDAELTTAVDTTHNIAADTKSTKVTFKKDATTGKTTATITLSHNQSMLIKNLPNGTTYTVQEQYDTVSADFETTVATGISGTLSEDKNEKVSASGTIIGGAEEYVAYTNAREVGSLKITKTVDGNDCSLDDEFEFTIELIGSTATATYPAVKTDANGDSTVTSVTFTNGKATGIKLKGDETITIKNLPAGTSYHAYEVGDPDDGYQETAVKGNKDTIVSGATMTASFTNTKNTYGSLTVKKIVDGNAGDTSKEFKFTVILTNGSSITGQYGGMYFDNGVATFTLKNGLSATAIGLPTGTTYTVTEESYTSEGYVTTVQGTKVVTVVDPATNTSTQVTQNTDTDGAGTIYADCDLTEIFTNTRDTYRNLTITKTVAGNAATLIDEFHFTVSLSDTTNSDTYEAIRYSTDMSTGTVESVTFTNGVSDTITLKDGESLTIRDLPLGVTYTVKETDYSIYGYVTTIQGTEVVTNVTTSAKETVDTDQDGSGTIYADCDLTENFTNTRNVGDVEITKILAGNGTDETQEFTFNLLLENASNQPVSGTYDATRYDSEGNVLNTFKVTFDADGKGTVTLKGGERIVIENILSGYYFRAAEDAGSAAGYTIYPQGTVTVTVPVDDMAEIRFENTKNTYADLAITKTVKGTGADETKAFKFTITLDDSAMLNDTTFEDTYDAVLYTSADDTTGTAATVTFTKTTDAATGTVTGVATTMTVNGETKDIALSHGQSLVIKNLPNGVKYTVAEEDYSGVGYTVTSTGAAGTIEGVDTTVTPQTGGTSTAAFVNTYAATGSLTLKATKSMARTDSGLGIFEFELTDVTSGTGTALQTVTNSAATGAITFAALDYTQEDIGKTFTYTVSEKTQTGTGYLFDETVYTVTVAVTDNGDGTLALTTTVKSGTGTKTAYTDTAMTFTNDVTSVKISKVDVTTEEELPGAHIQVLDEDGNIIDEWDSATESHEVTELIPGKTYTLRETVAPTGYDITTDTTFTLKEDGTIDTSKTTTTISEEGVLLVEDSMTKSETAEISVTKNLQLSNGDDLIATDVTFYVGLYADEACTKLYASKAIEFKNASASTVTFTELEIGRTYYIAECDSTGKALASGVGALADGTTYQAVFDNTATVTKVTVADGTLTTVSFANEFYTIPDGFYKKGVLTITKKLLGADGAALTSDAVFYAGIFTDASYTTLATNVDQSIVTLDLAGGSGSEVSVDVTVSIATGSSVTLYVTETDADGNPVANAESFAYTVSQDTTEVTMDETNSTAAVTITNQEIEEVSEEESEEVSEEETETETESKAVQTGDETPILPYMLAMLAALIILLAGVLERKRRSTR